MIISGIVGSIDAQALMGKIESDDCGGIVSFQGRTRSPNKGVLVQHLVYETWEEQANALLAELAERACERWNLGSVVAVHRDGVVGVGETSILVICTAVHRSDPFEACKWLVDTIKEKVPIWKKEVSATEEHWVGMPVE